MLEPLPAPDLRSALLAIVGEGGLLTGADTEPYCQDWRALYRGRTQAVVRPADADELAGVVRLCVQRGVPMVPQGGNTSMVGGAVPSEDGQELVVSLAR